jgi:hypothetical protein
VCSPFIVCSKSNPIVVFALDLMSAYEGEHTVFGKKLTLKLTDWSPDSGFAHEL